RRGRSGLHGRRARGATMTSPRRFVSALVTAGVVLPAASAAQGVVDFRPSVSISELYDSNVFAAPAAPRDDVITRVSPAIDAGYRTASWKLRGHYSLDADRYAQTPALTKAAARQHANLDLRHEATPRLTWNANAGFTRTSTPSELLDQTGVLLPPAPATHLSAQATMIRRLSSRTDGTAEYRFSDDRIDDGGGVRAQGAALHAIRRLSLRTPARPGYHA